MKTGLSPRLLMRIRHVARQACHLSLRAPGSAAFRDCVELVFQVQALLLEFFQRIVAHRCNTGLILGNLQIDRVVLMQKFCEVCVGFLQAMHGISQLWEFAIEGVWQEFSVHLGFLG